MTVKIENLATPCVIEATVPAELLERDFTQHWEAIKGTLPPHIVEKAMAGFRELEARNVARVMGGKEKMYFPVLAKHINNDLAQSCNGMLAISEMKLDRYGDEYRIKATGYQLPTVTWHKEPPKFEDITIQVPKLPDNAVDLEATNQIEMVLNQNAELVTQPPDYVAISDDIVEVACIATKEDGTEWPKGTFTSNKLSLRDGWLKYAECRNALLGTKKDDVATAKFTVNDPDVKGTISSTFTVLNVMKLVKAELTDDLAKKSGFPDKDSMVGAYKTRAFNMINEQTDLAKWINFCTTISGPEMVTVGTLPHDWVQHKTDQQMGNILSKTGGEQQALTFLKSKFPDKTLNTLDDAKSVIAEFSSAELILDLIVRSWAFKTNFTDGPWDIDSIGTLIDKIKRVVIKSIKTV